jgi:hypothetical protein
MSFDKLRTSGFVPFVVSLSNHEPPERSDFGMASMNEIDLPAEELVFGTF